MASQAAGLVTFPAGVAVGVGVGGAVAEVINPRLRELANRSWQTFQSMPLQAIEAAQLVANGERPRAWGEAEAANVGVNPERFAALVDMVDTALEQGLLMEAFRRNLIGEGAFRRGIKRHGVEDEWIDVLVQLRPRILSPAEAANAWQQGFMDEGQASAEAELSGVSPARSAIQRQLAGNPPGPMDGLTLLRRGIISDAEYVQLVREGNIKTKYTDALLALREHVLTAREWASLWLRGWVTEAEAKAGGAREGYDAAAMDLLYLNRGRPATTRQVHIGYQRGGTLPGVANEREAFERAVRNSNIRTEYVDLLWAQRHTYPSAFVIRALAQDGTFDQQTTERILVESGWVPEYAALAAAKWAAAGTAGPGTKWADRARSRLFSEAWADFLDGNADEAELRAMLQAVGATGGEQDTIVTLANTSRGRTRRDLTQAQVLKLYRKSIWTREQAQLALEDQGMDGGDASDLLDSV